MLWHGYKESDRYYWNTRIGKERPSWNIYKLEKIFAKKMDNDLD